MNKLFGAAAEARLDAAWEKIFSQDPAHQQIIHVLTRPTEFPPALAGFPPFEAWLRKGGQADDEVWRTFAELATAWPYVRNARRAFARGIPNVRIFVLERDGWESAPPWLRYLGAVHLPAIAALAGETLYRVWLEDGRRSGFQDRLHDVNLWGAAGVMLTGYQNGDVEWRAFLDDDPRPSLEEYEFVVAMRDLAAADGELIELPAQLQPGPSGITPAHDHRCWRASQDRVRSATSRHP